MTTVPGAEKGFSLTELLVAMLVTMIISGAVFGLLSAGQGAFRREPELTDRQQNIRLAMDLIQRDIVTAGAGLDPLDQAFTRGDNPNEAAPFLDGVGPVGPSGAASDVIEILGGEGACMDVPVTGVVPPGQVTTVVNLPGCFPAAGMAALIMPTGSPDLALWGWTAGNAASSVNFVAGPPKSDIAVKGFPGAPAPPPTHVIPVQLARYAIANDVDGVPSLYRSGRGGLTVAGARVLPGPGGAAGDWQLVARGIEDLQVRYRPAAGVFATQPPSTAGQVLPAGYATLVQEVEVLLWARTTAPSLQGQTQVAGLPNAVRGSLITVTSPRAALLALRDAPPPQQWQ